MKITRFLIAEFTAIAVFSCNPNTELAVEYAPEEVSEEESPAVYMAELNPLNTAVTGSETMGRAEFTVQRHNVHIVIEVHNAPANMEHWQNFHGFEDALEATCSTMKQDANGDGILDVTETGCKLGNLVPFDITPDAKALDDGSCPTADENGDYRYAVDIPLGQLETAFAETNDGKKAALGSRVLYIHGIPADHPLPNTVASISDIPAQVTLPIACGRITRVQ